ncbi:hypothetical protein HZA86_00035 [Candidatus Uhrbacteria bacterium]|nr:hypothetical protein [Candidatus Uhrbacteria bacterium]
MIKKFIIIALLSLVVLIQPLSLYAATVDVASDPEFNANDIISDEDLTDTLSFTEQQIQDFLNAQEGFIRSYTEPHPDTGQIETAAHIIWQAAQDARINPEIVLAILQKEQSLIEDPDPVAKQFDWATGYSRCDGCAGVSAYKGFGNQVRAAAKRLRYYFDHPTEFSSFRAGVASNTLDGFTIVPANQATAGLYIYNPWRGGSRYNDRLIGANYNFYRIWKRYTKPLLDDRTIVRNRDTNQYQVLQSNQVHSFVDPGIVPTLFTSAQIAAAPVIANRKLTRFFPQGSALTLNDAFAGTLIGFEPSGKPLAGSTTTYSVTFKNVGMKTWEKATTKLSVMDVAGAPSPLKTKAWPAASGGFIPKEETIAPGQTATFTVPFQLPKIVRGYDQLIELRYQPTVSASVDNPTVRITAYSVFGDQPTTTIVPSAANATAPSATTPTGPIAIGGTRSSLIVVAQSPLQGEVVEEDLPKTLKPGQKAKATIRIKNTGIVPWKKMTVRLNAYGENVKLQAPLYDKSWRDKQRVVLMKESVVKPGEVATFNFTVLAPKKENAYTQTYQWTLQDGRLKEWLGKPIRLNGLDPEWTTTTIVESKPGNVEKLY